MAGLNDQFSVLFPQDGGPGDLIRELARKDGVSKGAVIRMLVEAGRQELEAGHLGDDDRFQLYDDTALATRARRAPGPGESRPRPGQPRKSY